MRFIGTTCRYVGVSWVLGYGMLGIVCWAWGMGLGFSVWGVRHGSLALDISYAC